MAFGDLIVRRKRQIGGISIDGVLTENTVRTFRMTSHPIESGENVADHIITEPLTYTMEGVITDTPFGFGKDDPSSGVKDSVSGIFGKSDPTGQTRSQQIYYELVKLMDKKDLLVVQAALKTYEDLVMETISVTQTKHKSRSIWFTATFRQAIIVKTATKEVDSKNINSNADKAGQGAEIEQGALPIQEATTEETALIKGSSGQ